MVRFSQLGRLVADGKTYHNEKRDLYKSLIFPDVLENIQPVLRKAYYHVGRKDIGKGSGYRADTLKFDIVFKF